MRPTSAPASSAQKAFYRPELDGLRFFAFLAVYVNHTVTFGVNGHHRSMPDWVAHAMGVVGTTGSFGVDLFYVLSSYLITELMLRERRLRGALDVRAFYVRRVLRIWPLYLSFLVLAYVLTFLVPSERLSAAQLVGFLLFSGNWVYMAHPVSTVAAPLWSVSVEEQFYLLWPWAIRRASRARIAGIALGLMVLGMVGRCGLTSLGVVEPWISKNSFTRVDGIACGALLAVWLQGGLPTLGPGARAALLGASFALLLVVSGTFHLYDGPFTVAHVTFGWWLAAVATAGIVVSALGSVSRLAAPLRTRPLIYLGRISYGLYVWHQVALLIGARLFPEHDSSPRQWAERIVVGGVLTTALAAASYRWLEMPFLRLKQRRFTLVSSRPVEREEREPA